MARITHTQIEITKNPMLKVPIEVPQWEAHVVLALWGDDAVITGTVVHKREVPDANDEFTRLANKYGPRDEDIPFVARVYGSFGPGLRALRNEFQVSVAGSNIESTAAQVAEVRPDVIAPAKLAGFEGSKALIPPLDLVDDTAGVGAEVTGGGVDAPVAELGATELTDVEIDAIDKVPALDGNTVDGVPMSEFLKDGQAKAIAEAVAEDAANLTAALANGPVDISDLTGEGEKNPEAA